MCARLQTSVPTSAQRLRRRGNCDVHLSTPTRSEHSIMPATAASSARASPELPSLTNTANGTSASTSMPASPTADNTDAKAVISDVEEKVDVEELAQELKDEGESDPDVSLLSSKGRGHGQCGTSDEAGGHLAEMRGDECGRQRPLRRERPASWREICAEPLFSTRVHESEGGSWSRTPMSQPSLLCPVVAV